MDKGVYLCKTHFVIWVGHDTSRQILLIHSTIEYTQTYDYIDNYIAAIVIKIKLANRQNVTLIAHYRQWTLPLTPTDLQYNRQTYRYDRTLKNFETIIKDNNDVIIVGDDNIDTLKDNNKYNNYNNHELKDLRQQLLIDNDLTQHNLSLYS